MFDVVQAIAIGGFVLAIVVELVWGRLRARRDYAFHDAVTNISLGLGSLVFGTITTLQGFAIHTYLFEHASPFTLPTESAWSWLFALVVVDFCFYWSHRAMHRINLFWTVHAVHHQSQHLNLLVALRIGWFSVFLSWIFYLPLAFVGVSVGWQLAARGISAAYQFILHTRLVGKLGPLEYVLVTPSHHRVHHAINARYLDRNYGGMLIVWDRLFGTFCEETEEPHYGTTQPFASFDPIWSNLVEWVRIGKLARTLPRLRDKLVVWLRPPEWRAPATAAPPHPVDDIPTSRALDVYIGINVALALVAAIVAMTTAPAAPTFVVLAIELVAAMIVWGAWIERRAWARAVELVRLTSLAALIVAFGPDQLAPAVIAAALAVTAGLAAWTVRLAPEGVTD